jgi:NAD(P)-dependent dehydrogenase (short-subunit alcohol dehydrogenase family)
MRVPDPNRRNLLEGKVGLVIGGAGSLGLATARLFLKEGAHVVLADRNGPALRAAASRLDDVHVSTVVSDATREDDVAAAFDSVRERHGRLDVLVTTAGTSAEAAPVVEFDADAFDRTFAVHVRGVFLACKYALRDMAGGGSVVIISSVAGLRAEAGASAYAAAEHAQVGLMRAVAKEAAPRGIRVNSLNAGPVENGFQADVEARLSATLGLDATKLIDQQIPLNRHAQPDEIARSVLYLASAQSSFTTGTTLVVDGGLSA